VGDRPGHRPDRNRRIGAVVLGPSHERLASLAAADVSAAGTDVPITWSDDYQQAYRRMMRFEHLLIALVVAAIFFMTAKPFA
jgi:hypothetical protein